MRWLKLRAQGLDFAPNNKTMVDQPAVTTKLQNVYEAADYPKALTDQALVTGQTISLTGPLSIAQSVEANFGHFRMSSPSRFKTWLNQFPMPSGYAARYTSGLVLRLVG